MARESQVKIYGNNRSDDSHAADDQSVLQNNAQLDQNSSSQSPEAFEDDLEASGKENGRPRRVKRARACIACRNMKIRCLPVEGQDACSSCAKVNRECIMPGPPRKRQKTVHKVAELEKKINALTEALLAKGQQSESPSNLSPVNRQTTRSLSDPSKAEDTPVTSNPMATYDRRFIQPAFPSYEGDAVPEQETFCMPHTIGQLKENYVDVVERGDLSMETATAMFYHFKEKMCATSPIVVIPPRMSAQDLRVQKPTLFLTILTIASPVVQPTAQPALSVELNRRLAEKVLFHGEKSLDLCQALILNSQYYIRPRNARDLAFNQCIHSAVLMGLELGFGRRKKGELRGSLEDALESRRTWLACYLGAASVTALLRLPSLVRYTMHLEECMAFMKDNGYPNASDKWLCAMVGLQRLMEEASVAFNMDDPTADVNFLDPRIQYQLKGFERQLEIWKKNLDVTVDKRLIRHVAAYTNVYIHEIALHQEHNVDDFRLSDTVPAQPKNSDGFTASHIDALSTIMRSTHELLDIYLSLEIDYARSIPNLYIVWNTYAMVVLIKLHWLIYAPDSKLGAIYSPELKVTFYLDAILTRMAQLAEGGQAPCAEAFGFVWQKLKMWHMHRSGQFSEDELDVGDIEARRRQATNNLSGPLMQVIATTKANIATGINSGPRPMTPAFLTGYPPNQNFDRAIPSSNLNAAYDAATYGNTNWDQFNWTAEELNLFDVNMTKDSGWMGYLL
ncbi:hypothetical protein PV10_06283 [Exophiala mesophila]|uniref:Zn(2)-C6 fungal-type domain-containing protein n=1 Tax=Exophiala mesophila TaxID=212818 RepID=A0A0D1ZAR9_EXOME|nr:uncharacterized protein PV10_06283 [Exophiala mesophila]KIV91777.1 hypothetical protein PV10_06283 [Exophiala mesophila]